MHNNPIRKYVNFAFCSFFPFSPPLSVSLPFTQFLHFFFRQLAHIVEGDEPLVPTKAPLLVLLVCDDPLGATVRPSEMAEQLNLEELEGRAWCVQLVDMSTLLGYAPPPHFKYLKIKYFFNLFYYHFLACFFFSFYLRDS